MKLEDFVNPVRLNDSCRPVLLRHILSHLLYLSVDANSKLKKTNVIADLNRTVAVDFLAIHGITEEWELNRVVPNIVRSVNFVQHKL